MFTFISNHQDEIDISTSTQEVDELLSFSEAFQGDAALIHTVNQLNDLIQYNKDSTLN